MSREEENPKIVPINWETDDNFHFPLAGHALLNHDGAHFYIRFYQVTPPVRIDESEAFPESVKAKLVTGVAIPVAQMKSFIQALQDNFEGYTERVNRMLEDSNGDGAT